MKHRLTFEFTLDEINVLQVALDHMKEFLEEVVDVEGEAIEKNDWRYVNCENLISGFKKAVEKTKITNSI